MPVSKRFKRILWLVAAILVVVPAALVIAMLVWMNSIVKIGFERGGQRMLGVPATLADADVSILRERVALEGLTVGNPEGFSTPVFVRIGRLVVAANALALLKNEVHVREITLESPELTLEITPDRRSNVKEIMARLQGEKTPAQTTSGTDSRRDPMLLKIDLLKLTNVKVHVVTSGMKTNFSLGSMEIRNIADARGNAIPVDQVALVILDRVVGNVGANLPEVEARARELRRSAEEQLRDQVKDHPGLQKEGERLKERIFGK